MDDVSLDCATEEPFQPELCRDVMDQDDRVQRDIDHVLDGTALTLTATGEWYRRSQHMLCGRHNSTLSQTLEPERR